MDVIDPPKYGTRTPDRGRFTMKQKGLMIAAVAVVVIALVIIIPTAVVLTHNANVSSANDNDGNGQQTTPAHSSSASSSSSSSSSASASSSAAATKTKTMTTSLAAKTTTTSSLAKTTTTTTPAAKTTTTTTHATTTTTTHAATTSTTTSLAKTTTTTTHTTTTPAAKTTTTTLAGTTASSTAAALPTATPTVTSPVSGTQLINWDAFYCAYSQCGSVNNTYLQEMYLGILAANILFGSPLNDQTNPEQAAMFFGQTAHESFCLLDMTELCALPSGGSTCVSTFDVGSWCSDLNLVIAAGNHYYGRGAIQISYDCNYNAYAEYLAIPAIYNTPDIVADNSTYALGSAFWFFEDSSVWSAYASGGYPAATQVINDPECTGPTNVNQQDRVQRYINALACYGISPPSDTSTLYC